MFKVKGAGGEGGGSGIRGVGSGGWRLEPTHRKIRAWKFGNSEENITFALPFRNGM